MLSLSRSNMVNDQTARDPSIFTINDLKEAASKKLSKVYRGRSPHPLPVNTLLRKCRVFQ